MVYHPSEGVPPEDLEGGFSGYWLVSERLRRVMEMVDPAAFEFAETDYRLANGSKGPNVYLCDVVRTVDALDEDASYLDIKVSDEYEAGKHYSLAGARGWPSKAMCSRQHTSSDCHFTVAFFVIECSRML